MKKTLIEYIDYLKSTPINNISTNDLITYKLLIKKLEFMAKGDFGKLSFEKIELNYPYFLLTMRHASINCFLLHKKIVKKYLDLHKLKQ